jgi:putative hydrolase of the HAD superfamily
MSEIKVILFDADGVVVTSGRPFSHQHAAKMGFDYAEITPFFKGDFQKALVGEADLKDLLDKHRDIWRWDGSVHDLMQQWFRAEHIIDEELVSEIKKLREAGFVCLLATNQEKYRAQYLAEEMFSGVFDHVYSSAELGVKKPAPEFYQKILGSPSVDVKPEEVMYFDDDAENINTAKSIGINAILYEEIDGFYKASRLFGLK